MNEIVLLTGASSRLGRRIAESCASKGYVVYAGIHNPKKIRLLTSEWEEKYPNIIPIALDITNTKNCTAIVETIIKKGKHIDILINVAGIGLAGKTIEATEEQFLHLLNVNVIGPFRILKAVIPHMIRQKKGRIINITSLFGVIAFPHVALYCASKFALEGLGRSLRYELAHSHVFVSNLAAPSMMEKNKPEQYAYQYGGLRRFLLPIYDYEKVKDRVLWLLEHKHPPTQVTLGLQAHLLIFFQGILLNTIYDKGLTLLTRFKNLL